MLSGHPGSDAARAHARELLDVTSGRRPPRCHTPSIIVAWCTDHPRCCSAPRRRREQVHLRHRRCLELAREGSHRLLARPAPQVPWPAGDDVQARPLHQRGPGDDEPRRARRGLRHRGRWRDRPRPRALRALHRREPVETIEHDDRRHLQLGHRQGAPGRLPRAHRAGHPARHGRDQGPHPPPGRRGRRHRHRGDRRHRGRHRNRPLRRGHPPVPPGHRPRQRLLRPPDPGAFPGLGGAEDQADPALGDRTAQPGNPARRDRLPERQADLRRPQAQDLAAVRRGHRRRDLGRRRALHLRDPARPARAGPRRLRLPHPRHRRGVAPDRHLPMGGPRRRGSSHSAAPCRSASSAST